MRFVSHSPGFAVQVVEQRAHPTQYGAEIVDREGYIAQFNQDDVTDADLAFVEKTFGSRLPGMTVLTDEVTPTPLIARVSVYDTDEEALRGNWEGKTVKDDRGNEHDFKTYVERFLADRSVNHTEFRMVEEIPVAPPWPNYLYFQGTLEQLVDRLVNDGYDLQNVLAFERQTAKRQAVIDAVERVLTEQEREIEGAQQIPA